MVTVRNVTMHETLLLHEDIACGWGTMSTALWRFTPAIAPHNVSQDSIVSGTPCRIILQFWSSIANSKLNDNVDYVTIPWAS